MAVERSWKGVGDLSHGYFSHLRHHATARRVSFSLTIEQAWSRFEEQLGRCAFTGVELTMTRYAPDSPKRIRGKLTLGTASVDRIDSRLGYEAGNVQWVHKEINRMKGSLPDAEFIRLCKLVAAFGQVEKAVGGGPSLGHP